MTDETRQTPPSSPGQTSSSSHHKPHITWSDSYTKSLHAIESLSAILPFPLPSSLSSSQSPASALLHESKVAACVSAHLRRPGSGAADDALCAWLYDTFHSSEPELHLVVLRFLPALAAAYLSRAALHQPLAGFESVLLAIYAHETAARGGQAVTASIPDMAHPSVYHEANKQAAGKNGSTELHLAVISPSLEPHGTVRSTRRATIVGVAMELYYSKIYQIPVGSRIEFCNFCKIWSGQETKKKEGERKGRINLPWELWQPILRILGHCLMGPEKNEELFQAAFVACKCMHARAMGDINPKAILTTMSLVKLAERAIDPSVDVVDHTEITMSNVITI
ncbi:hypothetical protein PHJA_001242400 [Phtheirospermum japonicum]|uniref:Hyccin n=1 Tax=Phtheirospermum japonicum TaxID=374723 RepID=A0A830C3Y7_9LAMI|nr:hypothetical protein PHJA_001242400 [Phtheirospermum japonicum]